MGHFFFGGGVLWFSCGSENFYRRPDYFFVGLTHGNLFGKFFFSRAKCGPEFFFHARCLPDNFFGNKNQGQKFLSKKIPPPPHPDNHALFRFQSWTVSDIKSGAFSTFYVTNNGIFIMTILKRNNMIKLHNDVHLEICFSSGEWKDIIFSKVGKEESI